jgi:hypothetical protein
MILEEVVEKIQGKRTADMTRNELVELFSAIAEHGATNALKRVGLHDDYAISDIKDLRDLLKGYRVVKKSALQQFGRIIIWILVLLAMSLLYNSGTTKEIVKAVAPILTPPPQ